MYCKKLIVEGSLAADSSLAVEWKNIIRMEDKIEELHEFQELPIITLDSVRMALRRLDMGSRAVSGNLKCMILVNDRDLNNGATTRSQLTGNCEDSVGYVTRHIFHTGTLSAERKMKLEKETAYREIIFPALKKIRMTWKIA